MQVISGLQIRVAVDWQKIVFLHKEVDIDPTERAFQEVMLTANKRNAV
jgi:hypothetical protein